MTDLSPFLLPLVTTCRVAVLVDGDNFPFAELGKLETTAASMGEVVIRRVFGDAKKVGGWPEEVSYQMLHCDSSSGRKNLADMRLTIAAMDLAHKALATAFIVASDDRDFDPLLQFLRENGRKALRLRREPAVPAGPVRSPAPAKLSKATATVKLTALEEQIVAEIRAIGGNAGTQITNLNSLLKAKYGVKISDTVERTWRVYLTARPKLFDCDKRGPEACVRLSRR